MICKIVNQFLHPTQIRRKRFHYVSSVFKFCSLSEHKRLFQYLYIEQGDAPAGEPQRNLHCGL